MGMSPSESPSFFVTPGDLKRGIRTINKSGLVLAVGSAAVALGALVYIALSRKPEPLSAAHAESGSVGRATSSMPPANLAKKSANAPVGTTQVAAAKSAATLEVSLVKEQQEFDRQIRLEQQKRVLTKASLAASAETSDIGIDMTRADPGTYNGSTGGAPADAAVPGYGRLPSGGAGLKTVGLADVVGGLADPNLQGRKEAFSEREASSGYLPIRKQTQISPYEVKQGTVIPGIMISGINSDLPGQIIAQVSQNVYDTATGKHLLIPQGTRLVGSYDSYVAIGQERAMVAWRRLQFPDGAALDILNMPEADEGGYAGFNDQVNNHYLKIFGSAIMLSLVGAGYQLSQPTQHVGDPVSAQDIVAAQVGQQLSQVSSELLRRNMQIQPTIEIRPGYRFNIMVNKDMILEPYEEHNP